MIISYFNYFILLAIWYILFLFFILPGLLFMATESPKMLVYYIPVSVFKTEFFIPSSIFFLLWTGTGSS